MPSVLIRTKATSRSIRPPLARLPELAAHLTSAAQHQGVDSEHFLDWFITCLDGASSLLGLETLIKAKQEQLQAKERALAAASARLAVGNSTRMKAPLERRGPFFSAT